VTYTGLVKGCNPLAGLEWLLKWRGDILHRRGLGRLGQPIALVEYPLSL